MSRNQSIHGFCNTKSYVLPKFLCYFLLFSLVFCTPPEDPVICSSNMSNCTVTNSLGAFPDLSICRIGGVVYPTSEDEVVAAVANAAKINRKIKVATRYGHSMPKLVCPGKEDGLVISTKSLNKILNINTKARTMTVETGVILRDLIQEAAKAGLALPYTPYWWGLTIGGMLGTGAHGTSFWGKGSSVHDHVVSMRIVTPASSKEGFAVVRSLDKNHPHMNAVRVSLGVLGVISQVTFELQPLFKRSLSHIMADDADLRNKALSFGFEHEFGDIKWYPSQKKADYRVDDRVPIDTPGDGRVDYMSYRVLPVSQSLYVRQSEELREEKSDGDGKCRDAEGIIGVLSYLAYGFTNNGSVFTQYPVVGFQNHLQASGACIDSPEDGLSTACPWDPRIKGIFFHQTSFSIALNKSKDFIQEVQKLRDIDPKAWCGPDLDTGILIRFVKGSPAYLGRQEDGLDFDISYYRSRDPLQPRLYEDIFEEVEQMAMFKYGAYPHWGKNRNVAFNGVIKKFPKASEFLKVKNLYDPNGLFSNDWTDQLLGLKDDINIIKEGCALEGLCICSEDIHCAPSKGYFCRPGKVYTDARVCTKVRSL